MLQGFLEGGLRPPWNPLRRDWIVAAGRMVCRRTLRHPSRTRHVPKTSGVPACERPHIRLAPRTCTTLCMVLLAHDASVHEPGRRSGRNPYEERPFHTYIMACRAFLHHPCTRSNYPIDHLCLRTARFSLCRPPQPGLADHRVLHLQADGGRAVRHHASSARATRCVSACARTRTCLCNCTLRPLLAPAHPCVHALASLISSSLGARAQAKRPPEPGGHAGRARRGGRRRWRRGGGAGRRLLPSRRPAVPFPSARPETAACAPLRPAAAPAAPHVLRRPADCFRRPQAASDPTRSQYICLCAHSSVYIMCCL